MAVNIEVNLNRIDTKDIAEIERQLSSIGDGIDIDFDLDDLIDGDFEEIDIQLVGDDVDLSDLDLSSGDDSDTSLSDIQTELKRINGTILGTSGAGGRSSSSSDSKTRGIDDVDVKMDLIPDDLRDNRQLFDVGSLVDLDKNGFISEASEGNIIPESVQDKRDIIGDNLRQKRAKKLIMQSRLNAGSTNKKAIDSTISKVPNEALWSPKEGGKLDPLSGGRINTRYNTFKKNLDSIGSVGSRVRRILSRIVPSMGGLYAAMAALLPVAAGLAVHLGAVAVTLGALAVPAGVIGILGAMGGEADSLEGSMAHAQQRMQDFKQEAFQAVEPVADLFGPLVDNFLDLAIQKLHGLTDELAAMRSFSGIFFAGLHDAGMMVENFLQQIISLRPVIEGIAGPVGKFIATNLPEFFRNTVIEAGKTSDTLAKAAGVIWQVLRIAYEVVKAFVTFTAVLAGLTPILRIVANLLGNKWIRALLIIISAITSLVVVIILASKALGVIIGLIFTLNGQLVAQGSILGALASMWSGSFLASAISGIGGMIQAVWALNGALGITAKLATAVVGLLTLGTGLALAAGAIGALGDNFSGVGGSASGNIGGGGGDTTNNVTMNFEGDMDNSSRWSMQDSVRDVQTTNDLSDGNFGATR